MLSISYPRQATWVGYVLYKTSKAQRIPLSRRAKLPHRDSLCGRRSWSNAVVLSTKSHLLLPSCLVRRDDEAGHVLQLLGVSGCVPVHGSCMVYSAARILNFVLFWGEKRLKITARFVSVGAVSTCQRVKTITVSPDISSPNVTIDTTAPPPPHLGTDVYGVSGGNIVHIVVCKHTHLVWWEYRSYRCV